MNQTSGQWYPENYRRILEALSCLPTEKRCAVFDFDNTCIFHDIGQAVFRWQAARLHFRLTPEGLAALIPEQAPEPGNMSWQTARDTALSCYQKLWPFMRAGAEGDALNTPEAQSFSTLLAWLVMQARKIPQLGPAYVIRLLARLQAGYSILELQTFCLQALELTRREPLATKNMAVHLPEPLGQIEVSLPTGLCVFPEIVALMQLFQERGLACFIVSASAEWLVQAAAPCLGFPLSRENIFGVRANIAKNGLVLPEAAPDYPLTYRAGKNEVIDRLIGLQPFFAAGDAETDYEMLTRPELRLRLLINRRFSDRIASLYERPDVLLQGIDQTKGCFRPTRESV